MQRKNITPQGRKPWGCMNASMALIEGDPTGGTRHARFFFFFFVPSRFTKDPPRIAKLTPEQYRVTQQERHRAAGHGTSLAHRGRGFMSTSCRRRAALRCVFASTDKFESGCG